MLELLDVSLCELAVGLNDGPQSVVVELTDGPQVDVGELTEIKGVLFVGRKRLLKEQQKRWLIEQKTLWKLIRGSRV